MGFQLLRTLRQKSLDFCFFLQFLSVETYFFLNLLLFEILLKPVFDVLKSDGSFGFLLNDFNQVVPEPGLDNITHFTRFEGKSRLFKRFHHLSPSEVAQVPTLGTTRTLGKFLGKSCEILAFLQPLLDLFNPFTCCSFLRFIRLGLNLYQNVAESPSNCVIFALYFENPSSKLLYLSPATCF